MKSETNKNNKPNCKRVFFYLSGDYEILVKAGATKG